MLELLWNLNILAKHFFTLMIIQMNLTMVRNGMKNNNSSKILMRFMFMARKREMIFIIFTNYHHRLKIVYSLQLNNSSLILNQFIQKMCIDIFKLANNRL